MRNLLFGLLSIFCLAANARAAGFIEGLEDVPLMDGFVQIPHDNVSFGNEESRFVEAYIESTQGGRITFPDVERFYRDTLSQLGWDFQGKVEDVITFTRDSEALEVALDHYSPTTVRITVKGNP